MPTAITRLQLNVGGNTSCGVPSGSRVFAVRFDPVTQQPQLLVLWATDSFEYVTKHFITMPADNGNARQCPSMLQFIGSVFDQVGNEQFVFEVL